MNRSQLVAVPVALVAVLSTGLLPIGSAEAAAGPTCQGRASHLWGTDGNDTNATLEGNRALIGPTVVWLGPGEDSYVGAPGADIVCGDLGNDSIKGAGGNDVIEGGDGNDSLLGDKGSDQLRGQAGDDVSDGGPDDDTFDGGDGFDSIVHAAWILGAITVNGTAGTIDGHGADTYAGTERISGTDGPDEMHGGPADEVFVGGNGGQFDSGFDLIEGGGGDDVLSGHRSSIHGGDGADHLRVWGGDAHGGDGADLIEAQGGGAAVHGDAGADLVLLGPEAVSAYGDDGPDRFVLTSPKSSGAVDGGADTDLLSLIRLDVPARVSLTSGVADWVDEHDQELLVSAIESVRGTPYDDRVAGSAGPDSLNGAGGADLLLGRGGDDILGGGDGTDVGNGGAGTDTCVTETRLDCERDRGAGVAAVASPARERNRLTGWEA